MFVTVLKFIRTTRELFNCNTINFLPVICYLIYANIRRSMQKNFYNFMLEIIKIKCDVSIIFRCETLNNNDEVDLRIVFRDIIPFIVVTIHYIDLEELIFYIFKDIKT